MKAWEEFLLAQDNDLGKQTVDKWLRSLKLVCFDACNLYLEADSSFKLLWFEEHIRPLLPKLLLNNNNNQIKVHLSIAEDRQFQRILQDRIDKIDKEIALGVQENSIYKKDISSFDSFIVNDANEMAFRILLDSASGEVTFNPIYLWGRSGTGKTHLMRAVASALKSQNKKVIHTDASSFTDHLVNSIRSGEMQSFRKVYRKIDVLLVDNIHILSGKSATQEEFFHTFNTLHTEGKQIILNSTYSPHDLKFIAERLVSRFEWGIVLSLAHLDRKEVSAVLTQELDKINLPLDEVALTFLIDAFGHNMKSLMKAKIVLASHIKQDDLLKKDFVLSAEFVESILTDLIEEEAKIKLTPVRIIRSVAEYYGVRVKDILSASQSRDCVLPRQVAMHLCREQLQLPYMKIGDIFLRDHSTVMSSVKLVQKGLTEDNLEITASIKGILRLLEASA
ncbi:Chromosomal replication initiator protein DnaA 1 [Candidatus Clavichlamydia salmonicola]|uniref:DnaA ATPase domain-containing protein n=1 Tax=Candidatus Clavichlamydia salmonicola TaxID=469812 RepID=UPI001891D3DF|nr:DnaA/Hda family protein [Candidatus Clavichlamydia salmonicola]MBF5051189.1 Chromosomal replication initiator protein DnaA 1 [Candidatus Clavichlamydia salmonicola]